MTTSDELLRDAAQALLPNYRPPPFVLARGKGCRLEDTDGRSYLDLSGGIAVVSVGHAHPKLASAIAEQASRLMHTSNLFYNDRAIALASALTSRTEFDRAFFCNSGTEANEAMLKLARRHFYEQGDTDRTEIVGTFGSFHGRTMGSLTMSGQDKYHRGVAPLVGGVRHVPYGDADALREVLGPRTAAVIVEPVQGEGGVIAADDEYLRQVRRACDDAGAMLLFDEVQTGYGRTGRFLAAEHSGVIPDACSLAKGIGGGFPLGAMLVRERFAGGLPPGSHATTYGGNPLACAAGLAVLDIFDEERLVDHAAEAGEHLGGHLDAMARDEDLPAAVEARGRGLLRGIRLADEVDPAATLRALRERGVLATLAGGNILRFVPPLVITRQEIDEGLDAVRAVLRDAPRKEQA
jgi:predicted acetylornithine/succinylornithine family transaminase